MNCPNCNSSIVNAYSSVCPNCFQNIYGINNNMMHPVDYDSMHDKLLWAIALFPLMLLIIGWLPFVPSIIVLILMILDRKMLVDNGLNFSAGWIVAGFFIPQIYLFARCGETKHSYTPAIVSTVLAILQAIIMTIMIVYMRYFL